GAGNAEGFSRVRRTDPEASGTAARHGHIARRDLGCGAPRARAWPAAHGAGRRRLGRLPPDDVAVGEPQRGKRPRTDAAARRRIVLHYYAIRSSLYDVVREPG